MTKAEYIEHLAKLRTVEKIILNYTHSSKLKYDLQDLAQMVYMILLEYNENVIKRLQDNGEINRFIVGIIRKQYDSCSSPYYNDIVRLNRISTDLNHVEYKEDRN